MAETDICHALQLQAAAEHLHHALAGAADLPGQDGLRKLQVASGEGAGQGQVLTFAANYAAGGDMNSVKPGIDYLAKLHAAGNVLRTEGTTPYAKFVKGEIPIWIGYENDGLKAKHIDGMGDDVEVVIPKEASVAAPYAISLVKGAPHPHAGQLWLNFIMTDQGQTIFAAGFVRPSVPGVKLPADIAAKLPEAPQVKLLDLAKAAERKADVDSGWAKAVLNK